MSADESVSALVVVRPSVAGSFRAGVPIDRTNLAAVTPRADDVARVAGAMRGLGFDVGPMVGVSMSITAPRPAFESALHVELVERDGGWAARGDAATDDRLVPLDALPHEVAECIECITFEAPRELHHGETWTF